MGQSNKKLRGYYHLPGTTAVIRAAKAWALSLVSCSLSDTLLLSCCDDDNLIRSDHNGEVKVIV